MRLVFLGTSAGTPTRDRNVTSHAVVHDDGSLWLLDCGEATQHRFMRFGLRPKTLERILITHLHGDHCYGLPGMLACLGIHQRREPVQIVGPRGVRELASTVCRLSDLHPPFRIDWVEWEPGQATALPPLADDAVRRAPRWTVSAHPLVHRMPCCGYVLREEARPGRFQPESARALGVPEGPLWGRLQRGETVMVGAVPVTPEQVCAPARRGRLVALLGDTCDASAMVEACQGADVVVREATYDDSRVEKAKRWQHSTARMSGAFAAEVGARTLILTHLSARFTGEAEAETQDEGAAITLATLAEQAREACPGTQVLLADDGWSFELPPADGPVQVA